jgi:putative ABC transport system ATP-binding protein
MRPVLDLHTVTKTYGSQPPVSALRDVSFTVERGELLAIVGPSGSGKTTLLHVMGTLERASAGTVRIAGIDVDGLDDGGLAALRARSIGFVFQQFFLAEHQTALDNVADGLLYAGVGVRERRECAADTLARVGLGHRSGFRPTRMSGGERQRIAIARALLRRPRLLLLDEATSQLDAINEAALRETVADVARLITVLVVAHRLSTVIMADRIIVMDSGRVQAAGTHAELIAASPLYAELAATQFLVTDEAR